MMTPEVLPIRSSPSVGPYWRSALAEQSQDGLLLLYGFAGTSTHADREYRSLGSQRSSGGAGRLEIGWAMQVGSGGTANFLTDRKHPSAVFHAAWVGMADTATAKAPALLAAADLIAEIKATLGVNITELAAIAKVSRQTVYEWLDHGPISPHNYDRLFALREIGLRWKTLASKPIGRLIHARTDGQPSLFERLQQDPLDVPSMPPLLAKLAAKLSQDEESRQKRRRERERLADNAHYENLLTHVFPATDS